MKKLLPVLVVAVVIYFLITDYSGTMGVFHGFGNGVAQAGRAVVRAFKSVVP
jgi:hypothetical protein